MRGDDAALGALLVAFGLAAAAYYFLSSAASDQPQPESFATRVSDWFGSLFSSEPLTKLEEKDTTRESGEK